MLQAKSIFRCVGFIVLFILHLSAFSQSNYTFTSSLETYSSISGTEVDIDAYSPIEIGFPFNFNGVNYTKVIPSRWGWLSFNTSLTSDVASGLNDGDLTNSAARPLIGALYCQNGTIASSRARYLVSGSAPNRVFTFEWYDWKWHWYTTHRISFQVKLYETSNKVECCYHPISFDGTFYSTTSIGLAFANAGDFLSLSNFSNNPSVSTEVESHDFFSAPADNLKYTFELNTTKPEPTNQCTNLTTSIIADNLMLSWDDATGGIVPDGYLIKASTSNNFTDPVDGTAIVPDNDLSDGAGVVKVVKGQKSYFGWRNVGSSTSLYFKVFAYTNEGVLVNYNTTAAPTTSGALLKSAPNQHATSFSVKNNNDNLVFDWKDVKRFGNAIKLSYNTSYNDASNYVDCGSNSALNISGSAITLEAWINPFKTGGAIFQKENSTLDAGYRMFVNDGGELCFGLYINGSWSEVKTIANILPINTWSHICGTYNGTTQSIYINGKLLSSKATSGNITISNTNLFIGRNHTPSLNAFDGKIDEMAIWSIARTQPEIQTDLNLNLTGSEAGLVAYYKCNQGVADSNTGENSGITTLADATSNAIHASLINFQYYDSKGITASNTNSDTDGYLLLASSTASFPVVANGTDFPYDNSLADGTGAVKVAQGTQTFSQWSNTDLSKTNSFRLYPYNNKGSEIVYYTGNTIPELVVKPEPVNHVTNFTAASVQCNVVLSWTDALGAQLPDGYLILASKTGTFTPPIDGIEIAEDKNLADGSGAVKVVSGVQTFSQWIGFESGVTYTFAIYPYTNSGLTINYKTNQLVPQSSSSITISAEPTFHATNFTAKNLGTLSLTWKDAFDLKNCLNFDGIDDYVSCGSQNTAAFTIEAWVNPSRVDVDQAIVSTLNEGGLTGCELHIGATGKPVLTIRNSGAWLDVISATTISANTWTHLAATFNGSTVFLYVNGTQVATQAASSLSAGTNQLVIGRRSSGLLNFSGKIDEVRVWSTAQAAANLTANMNMELLGSESGLLSYYKFNQGTASGTNTGVVTLTDATTNSRTGTLTNFGLSGTSSNWVKANQAPDGYLIKASTTNSFADPVDFTCITTDNNLLDGNGIVKVSKGIQTYAEWNGLKSQTTYYFKIYPFTNEGNYTDYKIAPAAPEASVAFVKSKPITHVTNLTATHNDKVININWTDAVDGTPSFGNAIALDGTNDYISIPAIASNLSTVTIETWLNYSAITAAAGIFNTNSWSSKDLHFQIWNSNAIEFAVSGNNPSTPQASYSFAPNTWYHLAVTYNSVSKQAKYYVNGALIQTINFTTAVQVNLTAAQLGAWTTSRYFNGKFDEYRIWNTERSQAEIYNNMYSELSGYETGLLAYYKFNQGVANGNNAGITTTTDASPNAKNGSLLNFSLTGNNSNWVSTGNIGQKVAAPDGYLIKASKNKNIAAPINGSEVADDLNLSDDLGTVNVLQGVQAYNGWTNANDTTRYYFKVFPYTNAGTARVYNTLPTTPTTSDSTGIKQFKELPTSILGVVNGVSRWADYDNDGDLDLLVVGGNTFNSYKVVVDCKTKLYKQNSDHSFTEVVATGFINISNGDAEWGDYNNDGLLDLIISGVTSYSASDGVITSSSTKLYKQNIDHSFTEQSSITLPNLSKSSAAWGDYDNDGDWDLVISGLNASVIPHIALAKIYRNNGNNTFTAQSQVVLEGIYDGSVAWGDYDNDGYLDLLLTGNSNKGVITKLYKNTKNNFFFEPKDIKIPGTNLGNAVWGDYDNDGDLDILLNGNIGDKPSTIIHKNNYPEETFTEITNINLTGTNSGNAQWGDINNDGMLDILISGYTDAFSNTASRLFLQNTDNSFTQYSDIAFKSGGHGIVSLADFDKDSDLDFLITGYDGNTNNVFSSLYQNNLSLYKRNDKPSAPTGLIKLNTKTTTLSWNQVSGDKTPSKGLSYNIRVGKTSGGSEIVSPIAVSNDPSGFKRTVSIGNCQQNNYKILNLPPAKNYYWSVQAVDNGYLGGSFSEEKTFDIDSIPASELTITRLSDTEVKLKWTRGNGVRCAVFCAMDSSANSALPVMGQKYVSNSTFTQGDPIKSTSWFCVYNGEKDSVIIDGLFKNTTFTVQIVEYVWGAEDSPTYYRQKSPANDDWGIFNMSDYTGLPSMVIDGSASQWADLNNDDFLDYACVSSGFGLTKKISFLALNNGDNTFTKKYPLPSSFNQWIKVADFDNDGYQEIVYTGQNATVRSESSQFYTFMYDYDPVGMTYNQININPLPVFDYYTNESYLCDYNNDGYVDIVMKGSIGNLSINKVYYNNKNKNFEAGEDNPVGTEAFLFSNTADYDNDGDIDQLDFLGLKQNNAKTVTGSYAPNKKPSMPTNLNASLVKGSIRLSWSGPKTDETFPDDFSYDVRLRKAGETLWYNALPTDITGYRRTVTYGKYQNDTIWLTIPTGTYEWQIQAIDRGYSSSEWSEINTFAITPYFSADTVCQGLPTHFIDKTITPSPITKWEWIFGDGEKSYEQNPAHVYPEGNTYIAKLVVTYDSKSDTIVQSVLVRVKPKPLFLTTDVCSGLTATMINKTNTNGFSSVDFVWDFGDNKSSISLNESVNHTYNAKGTYNVELKAKSQDGCADSLSLPVVITETPNATLSLEYGTPVFCQGDSVIYAAPDNSLYSYRWKHNGIDIAENTSRIKIKNASGGYQVLITNKLASTCTASSEEKQITVKERPGTPIIEQPSNKNFCSDKTMLLNTELKTGLSYQWLLNGGTIKDSTRNQLVAKSSGDYTIKVLNSNGCDATSNAVELTMNPLPEIPSVTYGETSICDGNNVTFSVTSNPAITYQWFQNNAPVSGATSSLFVATKSGNYFLQVSNSNLCSVKTTPVTVIVKETPAKPNISETNNNTTYCPRTEVELKVNNLYPDLTYQWKRSGVAIAGANQPNYQGLLPGGDYVVEAYNGICTIESDILTLTTKSAPPKPAIYAKGSNVWLLACDNTTAKDYRWYYNEQMIAGAKSNQYVANQTLGNYYVEINDGGDCYTQSDVINIPTGNIVNGISNLAAESIIIHPNPTSGIVNINLGSTLPGELKVEIVDATGRLVDLKQIQDANEFTVDLAKATKGIYFCKISYNSRVVVKKIIKQ